ncbi:nicotinate-nucleotide--dimethylbenzimidazole phosphoribosyltransferase [Streptomyces bluensis]|uniref:nicotinate-nucleotide--dimethylbenzimidazole phosphoribosyltransferase n=1 Tax=Streptomyces bluensis TaxID=33897 RepID=UPI001673D891|nr:nicotinate-nucleotide--dimethylbenzimidazole phosphoribosyltransferase [Streptomyces bluensis]
MTDTGQVPAEGLPENAGMVEQPGVHAPGAYTYLSGTAAVDDELLLPGAQGAWGHETPPPASEPVVQGVHEPGPHETDGRDTGAVDVSAVRAPGPSSVAPETPETPAAATASGPRRAPVATPVPQSPVARRPLHLGPPTPGGSASPVRSLADRGPAGAPVPPGAVRQAGSPATGPEYLDTPQHTEAAPRAASPWVAVPVTSSLATGFPQASAGVDTVPSAAAPVGNAAGGAVPAEGAAAETVVPENGQTAGTPTVPAAAPAPAVRGEVLSPQAPEAVQNPEVLHALDGSLDPSAPDPSAVPVAEAPEVLDGAAPAAGTPAQVPAEQPAEPEPVAVVPEQPQTPQGQQPSIEDQPAVAEDQPAVVPDPAVVPEQVVAPQPVPDPQPAQEAPEAQATPGEEATEPEVAGTPSASQSQLAEQGPQLVMQDAHIPDSASQVPDADSQDAADRPVDPGAHAETPQAETPRAEAAPQVESVPEAETVPPAEAPQLPDAEAVPAPEEPLPGSVATEQPVQDTAPAQQPLPVQESVPAEEQASLAEPTASEPLHAVPDEVTAQAEAAEQQAVDQAPPSGQLAPVEGTAPAPEEQPAQAPETEAQAAVDEQAEPAPAQDEAPDVVQVPEGTQLPETAQPPVASEPDTPSPEDATAPAEPTAPVTAEEPPAATEPPAAVAEEVLPATEPEPPASTEPEPQTSTDPEPDARSEPEGETEPAPPAAAQPTAADETLAAAPAPDAAPPAAPEPDEAPIVTVPAPREPEAALATAHAQAAVEPEAPGAEPPAPVQPATDTEPDVVQRAEDLDTRAADQEESTAAMDEAGEPKGPAAPGYEDAEREAVLRVMRERRDIRNGFRDDPIPHDVLLRVLEAAHTAPSVGHSQPWDFVVIRSAETRRTMHELAERQREAYAKSLPKGRAKQFKELKIEAILDTPVNIVVTADPTRGGRHTLGRHTQPQMAPYSSALAVENLWLAARAEGLGVGWVSFFDEREMVRALGLPEHLEVVAYLCVGYVDEFPEEPELLQAGWSKRRPLSWVVHEETYGRRALPGEEPHDLLAETVAGIRPLDAKALGEAWERQKRMTKPAGALGMLEIISAQLSGLSRQCPPPIPEPAAVAIFAGDHGVHAQGVTPWPQEVTAQMVANFLGGGAVCNAFAGQVGAEVCVVDVGVACELPATPGLLPRKVRAGTADMTAGPALTREEVKQAIEVGIETARDLVAAGNKALLTGEMGIANTTASAALIAVFTDTDPSEVTGRGTGINDETLARKTEVVRRAIELHQPDPADPIGVLAAFGGLEHAALVGLLLGGASLRTPVILDGVSAGAAALVARAIAPEVLAACIAGHRSAEPGHVAALKKLGLRPLVDLDLRLGEGTGALLALPMVQSTARAMHEVATFDSAGVTEK